MMKALRTLAVMIVAVGLAGCPGPKPPTPTPTPDPTPTPVTLKYSELELRQAGGALTRGGSPHAANQFIACCMEFPNPPSMWPGVSKSVVDYAVSKGANMFHFRLGPFFSDAEPEYATIGGAYIDGTTEFNPKYWGYVVEMADYIGDRGCNLEIDLIDGWGCKHTQWGEHYTSFPAADVNACGKTFTAEHKRFVQKAVQELGCRANVIWSLGNENGQIDGFNPQYELDMVDAIREAEAAQGCTSHMIGTNSEREEVMASPKVDYIMLHKRSGIDGPWYNKWTSNNERNPGFEPPAEHALFCAAQLAGQHWAFWRAGMSDEAMDEVMNLRQSGCGNFDGESCPFNVPAVTQVSCKPHAKTNDGGDIFDCTPLVRDAQYCRSIGMGDRLMCPLRPEGDPFRGACEIKSMGGSTPTYRVSGGSLILEDWHGGFQFILRGTGSGVVTCTVPSRGAENVCVGQGGGALVVQR